MLKHSMRKRIYYGDTDAMGIVYHPNYLSFFEMARCESLRSLGIQITSLLDEYGIQFAVFEIEVRYYKPARLDDHVFILSEIIEIGRASLTYQQSMYLPDQQGDLLCEAKVKLVVIDKNVRATAIPEKLKQEIFK